MFLRSQSLRSNDDMCEIITIRRLTNGSSKLCLRFSRSVLEYILELERGVEAFDMAEGGLGII